VAGNGGGLLELRGRTAIPVDAKSTGNNLNLSKRTKSIASKQFLLLWKLWIFWKGRKSLTVT
jgi:hypothetical protein